MDRKFLESLGIEKDNVEKIMAQYGIDITSYKTEIGTKDATINKLRKDVIEKDGKIAELEKIDVEDLQTQLTNEREAREKDRKEFTLKSALMAAGCSDVDYVLFKLGDSVEFDEEGNLKDPDSFVEKTKKEYEAFFGEAEPGGTGSIGNFRRKHGSTSVEDNPYTKKGWNLTKQMELELRDPEKAKQCKEEAKMID